MLPTDNPSSPSFPFVETPQENTKRETNAQSVCSSIDGWQTPQLQVEQTSFEPGGSLLAAVSLKEHEYILQGYYDIVQKVDSLKQPESLSCALVILWCGEVAAADAAAAVVAPWQINRTRTP